MYINQNSHFQFGHLMGQFIFLFLLNGIAIEIKITLQKIKQTQIIHSRMLKICLIGPQNSGKSLFVRTIKEQNLNSSRSDAGVHYFEHQATFFGKAYNIDYWKVCERRQYAPLVKAFVKSTDITLIFYNPKQNSFCEFNSWAKFIPQEEKNVYIIFISKVQKIPAQIIKYKKKFGWKLKQINVNSKLQCFNLEEALVTENEELIRFQKLETTVQIVNFFKKITVPAVLAALGIGIALFRNFK